MTSPPPIRQRDTLHIPTEIADTQLDNLDLSIRLINGLARLGYQTLGQLDQCETRKLLRERNFGRTSLNELQNVITALMNGERPKTSSLEDIFDDVIKKATPLQSDILLHRFGPHGESPTQLQLAQRLNTTPGRIRQASETILNKLKHQTRWRYKTQADQLRSLSRNNRVPITPALMISLGYTSPEPQYRPSFYLKILKKAFPNI